MEKSDFRILIADDDSSVRDVVRDMLMREGYVVDQAVDGRDAQGRILAGSYHLIITDLMMPGADGLSVLKSALSLDPDTSVVIITAYATLQSALEAVREGAYDYVTKPFRLEEMLVTVGNAYKRTRLIQQNRFLLGKLKEQGRNPNDPVVRLERLSKLKEHGFVDEDEFYALKEKVIDAIDSTAESTRSR